jgi:hypothetical protein
MADNVSIQLDLRDFNSTLQRYMEFTKKDLAEVVNTKAFFICLKALKHTPNARASQIEREMRQKIIVDRAQGKTVIRRSRKGVARVNLIVNARRKWNGDPGLQGAEMEAAALKIINARKAAVGFAKAGWVWALRDLAPYVPSASRYATAHGIRIGSRPLGSSTAAQPGLTPAALIANRAWPTRTPNVANVQRLQSLMRDALARAIDEEEDDMLIYMERKLQDRAREMQNSR